MPKKHRHGFTLNETGLDLGRNLSIVTSSDRLGWPNISASLITGHPYDELLNVPNQGFWLFKPLTPWDASLLVEKKEHSAIINPSHITLIPRDVPLESRRRNNASCLHLFLKDSILTEVAAELFDRDANNITIVPAVSFEDTAVNKLMDLLRLSLSEPPNHSALKVDYLSRALVADVLARHVSSAQQQQAMRAGERLTPRQGRLVAEYIRERLDSNISISELASVLGVGRTIFARRFKGLFKQTPHQYLMEARIRRAQDLLATTNLPMPEIAVACGFSDQAHFSMRFKQATGETPTTYRRQVA